MKQVHQTAISIILIAVIMTICAIGSYIAIGHELDGKKSQAEMILRENDDLRRVINRDGRK
jgi:hypothetical protein